MYPALIHSTVWATCSTNAKVLWVTLIGLANAKGHVDATDRALAHISGLSDSEYASAAVELQVPDKYDHDRPHITRTEHGWRLSQWQFDSRRLRAAERQRRHRERLGAKPPENAS